MRSTETLWKVNQYVPFRFINAYEASTLRLSTHTKAEHPCLQVFHQAGEPQWVDCLVKICTVSFPRTQRLITSSGIKPQVSNLLITT